MEEKGYTYLTVNPDGTTELRGSAMTDEAIEHGKPMTPNQRKIYEEGWARVNKARGLKQQQKDD